jgi:hypothetical protein
VAGNRVAVDALGLLAEPLQEAGGVGDLDARLGQRLALLGGQERRQLLLVVHQPVGPAAHDARAVLGEHALPARQRALGGLDRAARLGRAHARDLGHGLLRRGVDHREGRARIGVDPLAVDVAPAQQEIGLEDGHHPAPSAALISAQVATLPTLFMA